MTYRDKIDLNRLPNHIAVIMDGNGRWAKRKGKLRVMGHQAGVKALRNIVEEAVRLNIGYLTVYTFSTENWNRPSFEVKALMELLVISLNNELEVLMKNNICLNAFGDLNSLPSDACRTLNRVLDKTSSNTGLNLNLAISYGSRKELTEAARQISLSVLEGNISMDQINEDTLKSFLSTSKTPDPELLIRTGGECRLSNFLLWQSAYSELYFTETLWPDFSAEDLYKAIIDYQSRDRRFGLVGE